MQRWSTPLKLCNLGLLALIGALPILACGSSDAKHRVRGEETGGDATAGGDQSTEGGVSGSSGAGGTGGSVDRAGGDGPGGDPASGGDTAGGATADSAGGVGAGIGGSDDVNACVNPEPLPKAAPSPSAGCSKLDSSEVGSAAQPLMIAGHRYYVKLPTAYEPTTPYPVVYAFHPAGNAGDWSERVMGYETNAAQDTAIRVYPTAANLSAGWTAADLPFFAPLHEKITADYCVDQARAFAAGESPGGNFAITLGCEHGDLLRAVASCANTDHAFTQCTGQTAIVLIHGKFDNQLQPGEGGRTRDAYAALNHCGSTTTPVTGYTDTLSNCVQYDCCDAGKPVYWCEHTDPEYAGTSHGWPAFAGKMTWEVFASF